jgi:hypothetical protein
MVDLDSKIRVQGKSGSLGLKFPLVPNCLFLCYTEKPFLCPFGFNVELILRYSEVVSVGRRV